MNKIKILCKISLVSIALILLLVSSAALAATESDIGNATIEDNYVSSTALPTPEGSASPKITETKISTSGYADNPAIYNNRVVWIDTYYTDIETYYDVYMYDLSTKKETSITFTGHADKNPTIYGDRIVYSDHSNGDSEIFMYDLSTKKVTQITTSGNSEEPTIYNNRIVWTSNYDIYMYDLSTKKETQITSDESIQGDPAIYGDRIVWRDNRNGNWDIYMYDLSTKKETQITNEQWSTDPSIYGDRIVWMDEHEGNWNIYMYDLSTKKETQITSSPDAQTHPAIYGNRIVWEDDGGEDDGWENHGIYMYDISTKQKTKISSKGLAYRPAIYGNNVVWQYGNLYGNGDIYMGTVSNVPQPKLPVAAFSAKPTSGKAPLKVQFTDKSTGVPTKWKWSFGDGKYSTAKNPVHTYSKAGKYTVELTASNAAGSNTLKKSGYINIAAPLKAPVAAFLASPRSGKVPLKVQFTDKSTNNPTSWKWSFGDGAYSTAKNPVHKYSKAGKYTVSLTAKNAKGSNTKTISGYIVAKK